MPEITIGITTYNLEKYIMTCFEELFAQTFQLFEIIVYDDCSTDQTREILKILLERHPEKIKVLYGEKPLRNPAKARNAILDSGLIQGKYIVFLDGDDRIENTYLEDLYWGIQKNHADIALCAYDRVEEKTGHVLCQEMKGFPEIIQFPPNGDILAFINGSLWNKMISVKCIDKLRLPELTVGEDVSFLLALYNRCQKIICVDKTLIHYQVRTVSVISNICEEAIYQFADELLRLEKTAVNTYLKDTVEVVAFIHIGISMPLRVYSNQKEKIPHLLRWTTTYFQKNFNWFYGKKYLQLKALLRHGIKGIGLWSVKICYRVGCVHLFLWLYQMITKLLHIEIKF